MNLGWMNFKIGVQQLLAYRSAVVVSVASEIILVTTFYFLWRAVFSSSATGMLAQWQFSSFFTYLLVARLLSRFVGGLSWGFFYQNVRTGAILYDLVQPQSLVGIVYWRHLGRRAAEIALVTPVIVICLLVIGSSVDALRIPFFLCSALLGFTCAFFFETLVSATAFFTLSQQGIQESKGLVITLLSGALFPLSLLPEPLAVALSYTPFPYFVYSPAVMLTAPTASLPVATVLLTQILWSLVLGGLTLAVMGFVRRRFDVQGG